MINEIISYLSSNGKVTVTTDSYSLSAWENEEGEYTYETVDGEEVAASEAYEAIDQLVESLGGEEEISEFY